MDVDQHFATVADLSQELELFEIPAAVEEITTPAISTTELAFQNYAQPPPLSARNMRIRMQALTVYG